MTQAKVNKSAKMEGYIALLRELLCLRNKLKKSQIWSPEELRRSTTIILQTETVISKGSEEAANAFLTFFKNLI